MIVKKIAYTLPVNVIGVDDQGRTLVQCPARGCGEPAYIDHDGRVVCAVAEAISTYMARYLSMLEDLDASLLDRDRGGDPVPPTTRHHLSTGID